MKGTPNALSILLRQLRKQSGYSQAQIAAKLGLTRPAYTYYETGANNPSLRVIRQLAEIYQVPVDIFLYPERYLERGEWDRFCSRKESS